MNELESPADSVPELPNTAWQIPRPSVLHLFLWTLCSAVFLAMYRVIFALQIDDMVDYETMQQASGVVHSMISGAVLAGTILLVVSRMHGGPPMLRQPGHWLLFVSAVVTCIYLPLMLCVMLFDSSRGGQWLFFLIGVTYLFPPIAYGLAARRSESRLWRLLFVGLAVLGLSQSLYYLLIGFSTFGFPFGFGTLSAFSNLGVPILSLIILIAAIAETVRSIHRDWLHWTGIVTHFASSTITLMWMFA